MKILDTYANNLMKNKLTECLIWKFIPTSLNNNKHKIQGGTWKRVWQLLCLKKLCVQHMWNSWTNGNNLCNIFLISRGCTPTKQNLTYRELSMAHEKDDNSEKWDRIYTVVYCTQIWVPCFQFLYLPWNYNANFI